MTGAKWVALCTAVLTTTGLLGCHGRDELPGPPITLAQWVPAGPERSFRRSRGVLELYLTRQKPSHTFWNNLDEQKDAWGTITLKDVRPDGTVVVDLGGDLRAKPGRTFPGTGIKVIASHPSLKTALLRSRWTHTVLSTPAGPATRPQTE